MTAEIVIMNKEAVALAADSAVTLHDRDGQKIFMSANKIFALSKSHPIGIMVYGSADFMGVPWETIIKVYRRRLRDKNLDTVDDYAFDFLEFLKKSLDLFPEDEQRKFFEGSVFGYFDSIKNEILDKVHELLTIKDEITEKEIREIVKKVIERHYKIWLKAESISSVPRSLVNDLRSKYKDKIQEIKEAVFEDLPISKGLSNKLTEVAVSLFVKFPEDIIKASTAGVVIAGFGNKDIFPCLRSYLVEGIVNNFLKYKEDREQRISFSNSAAIVPFAQSEVVSTFIEGTEPNYRMANELALAEIFNKYPEAIVNNIEKLDKDEKSELSRRLKKISKDLLQEYLDDLSSYRQEYFVSPILKVVTMLPKADLAAMSESFINLTSLKRKMSMGAETVGGPVDVAVISKGDGFIWIKRKHYFKPELNPQYFANYNKEDRG